MISNLSNHLSFIIIILIANKKLMSFLKLKFKIKSAISVPTKFA